MSTKHGIRQKMAGRQDSYFDEAYFERGEERGTAYKDYARSADESVTYREIAEALVAVFQPRKCLEIGCATGPIVRALNDLGTKADGVDVSEWAVAHRLHPNVALASADDLPFSDGEYDLVFSCHTLEHLDRSTIGKAIGELNRVVAAEGFQFHMLPLVGTYPFDYDLDTARSELRVDPTHRILEPVEWWRQRWQPFGWSSVPLNINLSNDVSPAPNEGELAAGQFTLRKSAADLGVIARAFESNKLAHRRLLKGLERSKRKMSDPRPVLPVIARFSDFIGSESADWADLERSFDPPISVDECVVEIVVELSADAPVPLRIALIDDSDAEDRGVLEFWAEFPPGLSSIPIPIEHFRRLQGNPDLASIDLLYFGGSLSGGRFRARGAIREADGTFKASI